MSQALMDEGVIAQLKDLLGPEEVRGLLEEALTYLQQKRALVDTLDMANNPEQYRQVVHQVKGTVSSLGALRVGDTGHALENALRAGQIDLHAQAAWLEAVTLTIDALRQRLGD